VDQERHASVLTVSDGEHPARRARGQNGVCRDRPNGALSSFANYFLPLLNIQGFAHSLSSLSSMNGEETVSLIACWHPDGRRPSRMTGRRLPLKADHGLYYIDFVIIRSTPAYSTLMAAHWKSHTISEKSVQNASRRTPSNEVEGVDRNIQHQENGASATLSSAVDCHC
jgi:hypothetical protein